MIPKGNHRWNDNKCVHCGITRFKKTFKYLMAITNNPPYDHYLYKQRYVYTDGEQSRRNRPYCTGRSSRLCSRAKNSIIYPTSGKNVTTQPVPDEKMVCGKPRPELRLIFWEDFFGKNSFCVAFCIESLKFLYCIGCNALQH
jgi:hypothetical protein